MAYESVKNQIDAYIKANGVNLITGPVLNAVLTTMLDSLGEGYAFQGVLNTTDTPSPAADIPQAWLASAGSYLGGSITVDEGELALIIHTADGWSKETVYRGVQLSHDAILDALGYTPADEADVATLQDDVADLQTDVSALQDKIQASKDLVVSSSGQQQIYLKEKNWGKKIAVRIVENTATLDSGTVILCQARTGASSTSKNLSSEYVSFETLVDIDRIYIFSQGAITGAGTITVEIVNGDSYYLTIIDAAPTSNSKKLVESGGVFDAIQQLGDNLDERIELLDERIVLLDDEVNGVDKSQNFGFNINATPVDYSKTVDIKAGKYNIIVEDNNNILPSNTYLYLDGVNKGYVKSRTTPLTIESDVSIIRLWTDTAASDSGNIVLRFEDTEPTKSLEEKIEDVDEKYNGEIAKLNAIYEYTSYLESERFEIGANKNNDGNSQYIYKEVPVEVASDELLVIECNSVTGCRSSAPFHIRGRKDGQSVYIVQYGASAFNGRGKKRVIAVDPSITNVYVQLYASTDGGLTDTYAVFEGLKIYKSKSGSKDLEKDYATYDKNTIPAYYLANNYLENKIDTIRQLMSAANGNYDAFIFNTDQHWRFNTRNSPSVIKYIADYITINRIFMGGDTADGINMDCYKAFRDAFPGNIYYTAGNHEYMNYFEENDIQKTQDILGGDIWMYYQSHMDDAVIGAANKNYYYVDNQTQKMRYIILNVFTDGSVSEFTDTQRDWLRDVALDVPSGYTVVIFTHHLRSSFGVVDPNTAGKIINVIDNYSGNGDIVAIIQGHTHYDFVWQTAGGNNVVATTCDKNEGREDWGDAYLEDDRVEGTITEIAFDVVVVDKTHKKATFVRIGAPAYNDDRPRDSSKDLEERTVVYEMQAVAINGTITLTPGITGTWTSSDNTIATVSNGVVTGIASGIAIITVVDSTNHRAVWYTVKVS